MYFFVNNSNKWLKYFGLIVERTIIESKHKIKAGLAVTI